MSKKVVIAKTATPKKVAVKKVAKKATSKIKTNALRPLTYAANEKSFWLQDGQVLNSLMALNEALSEMEKSVFSHHVTKEKNDFADWVEQVLNDVDCANALRKAKTPKTAQTVVVKSLRFYQI